MFVGHAAVGFASKAVAPRVSLGLLMAAPLLLDLLWPFFLALGLESVRIDPGNTAVTPLDLHDYPWSHSLAMALAWSALVAFFAWMGLRQLRAAAVLGAGVFSHWVLDFVTHRPDLPLWPGSATYVGLGLWSSKPATVAIELAMFAASVYLYVRVTRPKDRTGTFALAGLVLLLSLIYAGAIFGPPPPAAKPVMIAAFAQWLFVPWAFWIDRHREAATAGGAAALAH